MRYSVFAAVAVLAFFSGKPAHAETVKIGVVLPYSGVNADLGTQVDKAFDLYVKLHAKDIAPHKVEIVKRDEGPPSGANAKTVVTELIVRDKVNIIAGIIFSPSAIAIAPVVTQAKIPLAIANAGTAWITTLSPYIVRYSFSMWHHGYPMGQFAAEKLTCKTAAMAYTDFPPGKDSTEAFKTGFEKNGGKIVDSIPMGNPAQVPDMTPFFTRVKDAKPDCFYVFVPSGVHAAAVAKYYREVGLRQAGVKLIGPLDVAPDSQLRGMSDDVVGTIVMANYTRDNDIPENVAFVKAWEAEYGNSVIPDFMAAQGWDTMAAIFGAVRQLNGDFADADKVVGALKSYSGKGPRGRISIDPATRDVIQDERAAEVIKKADGTLGTKVIGVVPQVKDPCKELKIGRCGS